MLLKEIDKMSRFIVSIISQLRDLAFLVGEMQIRNREINY